MIINGIDIKFSGMGLFSTEKPWIHPARTEITYEIIYVTAGTVMIAEDEEYTLNRGDLLILDKEKHHYGFSQSNGKTEFYWLHISDIPPGLPKLCNNFKSSHLFRELLHFSNIPDSSFAAEAVTAHILAEIACSSQSGSQLSEKIYEWTRINADAGTTVKKIAKEFGYNNEYISRLMKKNYGIGLKQIIDNFIIKKSKDLLSNTDYSSKQISAMLKFSEASAFINFFKYHEGITPNSYRNRYTKIHMNNK